jgi:hypothetical protein
MSQTKTAAVQYGGGFRYATTSGLVLTVLMPRRSAWIRQWQRVLAHQINA